MKTKIRCLLPLVLAAGTAHASITTFLYQGRLDDGGNPANGTYDFIYHSTSSGVDWTNNPAPTSLMPNFPNLLFKE